MTSWLVHHLHIEMNIHWEFGFHFLGFLRYILVLNLEMPGNLDEEKEEAVSPMRSPVHTSSCLNLGNFYHVED